MLIMRNPPEKWTLTVQETGIADAVLGRENLRGALAEVAGVTAPSF